MSFKIEPIAGDASFRKFYRLIFKTGTKIAVVSNKEKYKNLNVYSAINNFLRHKKILAPKLYNYNFSKGIIIIQDFGNLSFYKILKKKNKFFFYKQLVDFLLKIQKKKIDSKIKKINGGIYKI